MKTSALIGWFALTTAALASPKDPLDVSRAWTDTIGEALAPKSMTGSLRQQSEAVTTTPLESLFSAAKQPPPTFPRIREPLYDAPRNPAPKTLLNDRPQGAVPWEYNGRVFWVVPLAPSLQSY